MAYYGDKRMWKNVKPITRAHLITKLRQSGNFHEDPEYSHAETLRNNEEEYYGFVDKSTAKHLHRYPNVNVYRLVPPHNVEDTLEIIHVRYWKLERRHS